MLLPDIFPVTCHHSKVGPGSTFVAIDGFVHKGSDFIDAAIARGSTKIVSCGSSDEARRMLAVLSSAALDYPANKLKLIGITGTKGKTTTAYITEHLLRNSGYKTALLGSIKNEILGESVDSLQTTPSSDYLHMFFNECVKRGVTHVIMEVSSHAIALQRVYGLEFDVLGFTNLAPEHMDFHKTMDDYFETKSRLFSQVKLDGSSVINIDDIYGARLAKKLKSVVSVKLKDLASHESPALFGQFNLYNSSMAAKICKKLGLAESDIKAGLKNFTGVPGRLQMHKLKNGARAFVDYAHNPSSFEAVLKTLRELATNNLIVLFGCGGDRDKRKRPVMGELAAKYGDEVIITDDNPRSEDREKIINEIYAGINSEDRSRIKKIIDRRLAIEHAVSLSHEGSIIALLGKGHETYYLRDNKKYYFDDFYEIGRF